MRVLYLTPGCFDKGGVSRYSRHQINALRDLCGRENVRVFSLLGPDAETFEDEFDVDWHGSGSFGSISLADRVSLSTRALSSATLWRPQAIFSAHVNFGPLLTLAGALSGAKTILNVYGYEIWSDLSEARKSHMRRVSHVISDCHFSARYVTQEGLHAKPPTVIWDPVDLDRFAPGPIDRTVVEKYGLPDPAEHLVVMSLGRLTKNAVYKGFDRLIPIVADIMPGIPSLRLVIAGAGR